MTIDELSTPVSEHPDTPDSVDNQAPAQETTAIEPEIKTGDEAVADHSTEPSPQEETPTPTASAPPEEPEPAKDPEPTPVEAKEKPKAAAEASVTVKDDGDLFDSYMSQFDSDRAESDGAYRKLQKGELVVARIIQVDKDRIFVNLGTKTEGVIPADELDEDFEKAKETLKVGDEINVVVIRADGGDGYPIVSKKRADFEKNWDEIERAKESGQILTATVIDRVKGGLVVDLGVRGFVPATHVGNGKLRNIDKYVGQIMQLKVIDIDRERKKVVLSNRDADELVRKQAKEEIFGKLNRGDIVEGSIRRLTDYGAFVDLGGVDGLLHISEMSWMRIAHPKEMFKEGQKIKVEVLNLDEERGKISLGHRQVLPDPWKLIKENYQIGQTVKITISRFVPSGAFIKLPEGAEAFMPLSEMSNKRLRKPEEAVEEGQEVEAKIIDLKPENRRMVLSLRDGATMGGDHYRHEIPSDGGGFRGRGGKPAGKGGRRGGRDGFDEFDDTAGRRGAVTSGATIGERLGALRGFFRRVDEDGTPTDGEGEATGATAEPGSEPIEAKSEEKE